MTLEEKKLILDVKAEFPNVYPNSRVVFIGYDPREHFAYLVAKHSIQRHSPNVRVYPLVTKRLKQIGLFKRETVYNSAGQMIDVLDGKPHSTEFTYTRFLVPKISRILGLETPALFIDCDFLCTQDINPLWDNYKSEALVSVVKKSFKSNKDTKMDGCKQENYNCKLWSACMFLDPKAPLTIEDVSVSTGTYLHQFGWSTDELGGKVVGELPEAFQMLNTEVTPDTPCFFIHYTESAPWFDGEFKDDWSYAAKLWWQELEYAKKTISQMPIGAPIWK